MRAAGLSFIGSLALLLAACHVGPRIEKLDAAREPQGAELAIELKGPSERKQKLYGELIEYRTDGLLVLLPSDTGGGPRLTLMPWSVMHQAKATDYPGVNAEFWRRQRPPAEEAAGLQIVSRFPQGLTSELLGDLLESYGQETLDTFSNS